MSIEIAPVCLCVLIWINTVVRGRPLVIGGGGEAKIKIEQGKQKICGRDYIQTNYQHKQKILKKKFVQVEKVRPKGHVTRCNFSCNLQCNSTLGRCKIAKYESSLHSAVFFLNISKILHRFH